MTPRHDHRGTESHTIGACTAARDALRAAGAHVGVQASAGRASEASTGSIGKLDAAIVRTQARAALTGLGWKPAIAHAAVAAAAEALGGALTLERLIFESLRRCPMPST